MRLFRCLWGVKWTYFNIWNLIWNLPINGTYFGTYFVQWSHLNPSCWQSKQSFSSHGTKLKNSWMWLWAKQSIIWIIIPNRKLYKPIPRLRLQHQPKPVSSFDPEIIVRFSVRGPTRILDWGRVGSSLKWTVLSQSGLSRGFNWTAQTTTVRKTQSGRSAKVDGPKGEKLDGHEGWK